MMQQDGSNGYDNKVAERTWLGVSVNNISGSSETSATVEAQTGLTVPGGSGGREATAMSRQQRRRQSSIRFGKNGRKAAKKTVR